MDDLEQKSHDQLLAEREEIRNRFPNTVFPDPVLEPLWYGRREINPVPERKAIVNKVDGNVYSICSDKYKVVHYEDVIRMIDEVVSTIEGYGKIEVCPFLMSEGGKMKVSLKFPEAKTMIAKGDNIFPKIEVFTSYDMSYKLMGRFGAFMLRCSNGMGTWKQFKRFARKHLLSLNLSDLQHTITEGLEIFGVQVIDWKKWSEAKLNEIVYGQLWEQLPFSAKEKERIELLPETGTGLTIQEALKKDDLTVWQMNSILTQFATHEVQSEIRRVELEPEIAKAMEMAYVSVQ